MTPFDKRILHGTLFGASAGAASAGLASYQEARRVKKKNPEVNPVRHGLTGALIGAAVGALMGHSRSFQEEAYSRRSKATYNHRFEDGRRSFNKTASLVGKASALLKRNPHMTGALFGGAVGATVGSQPITYKKGNKYIQTKPGIGSTLGGAAIGAIAGVGYGHAHLGQSKYLKGRVKDIRRSRGELFGAGHAHEKMMDGYARESAARKKAWKEQFDSWGKERANRQDESMRTSSTFEHLKDMEAPAKGFTTKAEAKAHYRKMMSKYHPDKNPSKDATVKSQKINAAWDAFKEHPDGFNKLAFLTALVEGGMDYNLALEGLACL